MLNGWGALTMDCEGWWDEGKRGVKGDAQVSELGKRGVWLPRWFVSYLENAFPEGHSLSLAQFPAHLHWFPARLLAPERSGPFSPPWSLPVPAPTVAVTNETYTVHCTLGSSRLSHTSLSSAKPPSSLDTKSRP